MPCVPNGYEHQRTQAQPSLKTRAPLRPGARCTCTSGLARASPVGPLMASLTSYQEETSLLTSDPAAEQFTRLLLGLAIQKVDTPLRGGKGQGQTQR